MHARFTNPPRSAAGMPGAVKAARPADKQRNPRDDAGERRRFLLVTWSLPFPPTSGDQQRTFFLHRALQACGDVDVLLLRRDTPELRTLLEPHVNLADVVAPSPRGARGLWRFARPFRPALIDRAAALIGGSETEYTSDPRIAPALHRVLEARKYDLIVTRYIRPAAQSGALQQSRVPVTIDVDDVDTVRYQSWLARTDTPRAARPFVRRRLRQVDRLMRDAVQSARHVWVASAEDEPLLDHSRISVLPNLPYPAALGDTVALPPATESQTIVFVGVPNRMNRQAVLAFIEAGWPRVREAAPRAKLRIVGGGWEELSALRAATNVETPGFVENLVDVYTDAAFALVPVFEGAGTKIKLLDAASRRRTAAVARPSLRGFRDTLPDGSAVFATDTPAALGDACVRLLSDRALRARLADSALRRVREFYSFDAFQRRVREDVDAAIAAERA